MSTVTEVLPLQHERGHRSALRFALIAFVVTVVTAAGSTAGAAAVYSSAFEGRVMGGVSVAGVLIGGLDRDAAYQRLVAVLPDATAGELTVTVGDHHLALPYADVGRRYELERAIDAAMAVGRTGSVIDRTAEQVRAIARGTSFDVDVVTYDHAVVDARVTAFAASLEREGSDASVEFRAASDGAAATWHAQPAQTGVDVDAAALVRAAHTALAALGTTTASTQVSAAQRVLQPELTSEEAEAAVAHAGAIASRDLQLTMGGSSYVIPAATIAGWVSVEPNTEGDYAVALETSDVEPLLAEMLDGVHQEAVDASLRFEGKDTVVAVPGQQGLTVDLPATVSRVTSALEERVAGTVQPSVDVATAVTDPAFTTEQAVAAAPRVRRVSKWTTYFEVYEGNYFGRNISIPTRDINGTTVAPNRWFDFLDAIGEITRARGYGPGGALVNGRTEPTGVIGGGMCSCSTTLFNAALRAGLQMGQRRNHYYYIDRYPVGLDATVWESGSQRLSMRFRNDTDSPILIRGRYRPGAVTFEIWSVPMDRVVEITDPIIRERTVAEDTIEYTDELPVGVTKRLEDPVNGFKAWITRYVRDRAGQLIHEDEFFSQYGRVDGITQVGVASDDPRNGTTVFR